MYKDINALTHIRSAKIKNHVFVTLIAICSAKIQDLCMDNHLFCKNEMFTCNLGCFHCTAKVLGRWQWLLATSLYLFFFCYHFFFFMVTESTFLYLLGEGGYVVCYEMADIERKLGFGRNSLVHFCYGFDITCIEDLFKLFFHFL